MLDGLDAPQRAARTVLADVLDGQAEDQFFDAMLVACELIANAIQHSSGAVLSGRFVSPWVVLVSVPRPLRIPSCASLTGHWLAVVLAARLTVTCARPAAAACNRPGLCEGMHG